MKTIKAEEVQQKIASNEDVILINALGADSFRAKHIPGSINIPAGKVTEIAEQVLPDKDPGNHRLLLGAQLHSFTNCS